jgi:hypothetical protein
VVNVKDFMNKKKEPKSKAGSTKVAGELSDVSPTISSKAELKAFLNLVKERIEDDSAAPIYAVSAMNYALNTAQIYDYLDAENKELARDVWLRISQSGLRVRVPMMLFSAEEEAAMMAAVQ